jgi:transposase
VYWVGSGKSAEWVGDCLLISSRTVWRYVEAYHKQDKSDSDPRGGSEPHLDEEQSKTVTEHISKTILKSTLEVVEYVWQQFGVRYSRGGMAKWLRSQGFRYKRPHLVPRSVTVEKQEAFIEWYKEAKASLKEDEVILFMDGVHPDHQTQAAYGWIRVGVNAQVPSTGKQRRLHYLGAVEVGTQQVVSTMKSYETIRTEEVIDFFQTIRERYPGKKLTLIGDQGPYHTSKKTKAFLDENASWIRFVYLPPRCPNLNLIERLWKLMREHVTHNRYYPCFSDFKQAVTHFFDHQIHQIKDTVARRLRDNFQIIKPVFMTD